MVVLKVVALVLAVGGLVPAAAWVGARALRWARAHPDLAGLLLLQGYLGDEWEGFRGWLGDQVDRLNEPDAPHGGEGQPGADGDAHHHASEGHDGSIDGGGWE